jgi:fibrillarin-like rRNA methylase
MTPPRIFHVGGKKFRGMFDPVCLCSKLAAVINVRLASSEAKEMTSILCLGIESGEVEICVVGL